MSWAAFFLGFILMSGISLYDLYLFRKALDEIGDPDSKTHEELVASLERILGPEFKARKRFLGSIRWEYGR